MARTTIVVEAAAKSAADHGPHRIGSGARCSCGAWPSV
jgi:hypothetical protein